MKGYRTLILNIAAAALGGIAAYNWGDYGAIGVIIVAAANFGLRFVTTTPVGES